MTQIAARPSRECGPGISALSSNPCRRDSVKVLAAMTIKGQDGFNEDLAEV
jgi:hypothetical protein